MIILSIICIIDITLDFFSVNAILVIVYYKIPLYNKNTFGNLSSDCLPFSHYLIFLPNNFDTLREAYVYYVDCDRLVM